MLARTNVCNALRIHLSTNHPLHTITLLWPYWIQLTHLKLVLALASLQSIRVGSPYIINKYLPLTFVITSCSAPHIFILDKACNKPIQQWPFLDSFFNFIDWTKFNSKFKPKVSFPIIFDIPTFLPNIKNQGFKVRITLFLLFFGEIRTILDPRVRKCGTHEILWDGFRKAPLSSLMMNLV